MMYYGNLARITWFVWVLGQRSTHPCLVRAQFVQEHDACSVRLTPLPVAGAKVRGASTQSRLGAALFDYMFQELHHKTPHGQAVWKLRADEKKLVDAYIGETEEIEHHRRCPASTYLEMPTESIFESAAFALAADDGVVDLGAGIGKTGARAVLLHGARRGFGIELSVTRFQAGCSALRRLGRLLDYQAETRSCSGDDCDDAPLNATLTLAHTLHMFRAALVHTAEIGLRHGDAATADIRGATRVLMFATCFPAGFMARLQSKLVRELPVGARVFAAGAKEWASQVKSGHRHLGVLSAEEDAEGISHMVWRLAESTPNLQATTSSEVESVDGGQAAGGECAA